MPPTPVMMRRRSSRRRAKSARQAGGDPLKAYSTGCPVTGS
jgi:hypothetical protein